jgi:non-homologous end joining protein Ku
VRRDDREPVDPDEIVRGFEIEKGRYVPLDEEDLDRLTALRESVERTKKQRRGTSKRKAS